MNLLYKSTRDAEKTVTASQAILKGLADDGGLFVPVSIPKLPVSLGELKEMTYQEIAYTVMKEFLTDFTEEELKSCIAKAYDSKFDTEEIAPLAKVEDAYYLELFHGATIAFKDMALSILPHLLTTSAKKNQVKNEIVILTATSGDTGKAALAGFADVEGTKIIVFYPKNGVSRVQELQMVTQKGDNTSVVAIHGNFDNAQSGVKAMFENKELEKELNEAGYQFSSANSINIGRLVPQVVYYVYAYAKLLQNEEIAEDEEMIRKGLVYTTDGETNLIGFHVEGNYHTAVSESFAIMGMTLFAEYLDGIAVIDVDSTPTLGTLTVQSAAGTASGDTKLTVTPIKESPTNVYKYKTDPSTAPVVTYGQSVRNWTTWDGVSDITATTGHKITVVEADSTYKAQNAGNATVTAKT